MENDKKIGVLESLERLSLYVENLEGLAHVCGVAFSTTQALSAVNEKDLERTFFSFRDKAEEIEKELQTIICAICKNNATLHYNV